MDNTTYRIVDAETETTIAYGMNRDAALDLLGMLMRWNAGVKIWMVQVDYCEEEHNRPQKDALDILASAPTDAEILLTPEEQTLLGKQVAEIKQKLGTINWVNCYSPSPSPEDERAMVESVPNKSKKTKENSDNDNDDEYCFPI